MSKAVEGQVQKAEECDGKTERAVKPGESKMKSLGNHSSNNFCSRSWRRLDLQVFEVGNLQFGGPLLRSG